MLIQWIFDESMHASKLAISIWYENYTNSRNFVKTYPLSAVSGVGFWAMAAAGGMTISSLELSACAPGCCCCSWWASSVGGKT